MVDARVNDATLTTLPSVGWPSIRSLRVSAVSASRAMCAACHERTSELHNRLQRLAVHSLLVERAIRSGMTTHTSMSNDRRDAFLTPWGWCTTDKPKDTVHANGCPDALLHGPSGSDCLTFVSAGGSDIRLWKHIVQLEGLTTKEIGLSAEMAALCSLRSFDSAAELLHVLPVALGPQGKLRCMLRVWDCVLGVLGLCTDVPSADDFLPGMACALIRAGMEQPPLLISALSSMVNFAAREDFEDMWLFHFIAAVELVAQLVGPSTPETAVD